MGVAKGEASVPELASLPVGDTNTSTPQVTSREGGGEGGGFEVGSGGREGEVRGEEREEGSQPGHWPVICRASMARRPQSVRAVDGCR